MNTRRGPGTIIFIFAASFLLLLWLCVRPAGAGNFPATDQDSFRLGERMYREGLLPSGEPIESYVKGDIPVSGTAFTCMSCHLRSGLGSIEGGVVTPPTTGKILYQPLPVLYRGVKQKYFPLPPLRPAYTDESLAEAIRSGLNPSGEILNDVMPRYVFADKDMEVLISYLKSLSSEFSPGYSGETLRFATVITEDADPAERDKMLAILDRFITIKNNTVKYHETKISGRTRILAGSMRANQNLAYMRMSLSRWVLKGPPGTWHGQLVSYYKKEPVFALIGGISKSEWRPVHKFSEEMRIPCLLPITDFPVVSETDWYTLYFSKGYYQEGEAAARYINSLEDALKGRTIVQIIPETSEGQALAEGFVRTWLELGHQPPVAVPLKQNRSLTREFLKKVFDSQKPAVVLLWTGPESMNGLKGLADISSRPEMIFLSSRYLGESAWTLPEKVRKFTYLTYPYTFSRYETKTSMAAAMGGLPVKDDELQTLAQKNLPVKNRMEMISVLTDFIIQLFPMVLMDMLDNYYRDNFFDVAGMLSDRQSEVYGRLSFGPGQRYASKGCYIVQLTEGPTPELVKRSEWVIH